MCNHWKIYGGSNEAYSRVRRLFECGVYSSAALHEGIRGEGINRTPPSTFVIIHRIEKIFATGTYNERSLSFQLIKTTCCLTDFHDNHSYINDVTRGRQLGSFHIQI